MEHLKMLSPLLSLAFYYIYVLYMKKRITEPTNLVLLYLYKMLIMMPFLATAFMIQTQPYKNFNDVVVFGLVVSTILGYVNIYYIIDNKTLNPLTEHKTHDFSATWRYTFLLFGLYLIFMLATNVYVFSISVFLISLGFFHTRYILHVEKNELIVENSHADEIDVDNDKMSTIIEKFIAENPDISVKNPYKDKED